MKEVLFFYSGRVNTPRLTSLVNVVKFENVFNYNAQWACPGELYSCFFLGFFSDIGPRR
ncbi:hypothetical protein SAMN05660413_00667 [Salegentibacter flavus]|uniref:Uncharacterized protein n=1 Tax=Salegentibacter flavus TaxID=287099 RepID=A0A1I4YAT5_9FLAO|nr:hypothetical protein SAMN05660413_00667 [Salegentibacter flavus]